MLAQLQAAAAGFDADQLDVLVADEGVEHADGVRAPADAGENRIRQAAFALENFGASFVPDHAVKIAHHERIRMRAERRAQ